MTSLEVDWEQVDREFSERRISTLVRRAAEEKLDVSFIDDALNDELPDGEALLSGFIDLWGQCAARAGGTTRLAGFYVYARAQRAWELTANHEHIGRTLNAAWDTWKGRRSLGIPEAEQLDVTLILEHSLSLIPAMDAENALNCSCPERLADFARKVHDESACLRRRLREDNTDTTDTPFGRLIDRLLTLHENYFGGVHIAARAVADALVDPQGTVDGLHTAAQKLAELESALGEDVYASELRSHREVLGAMLERIERVPGPTLRLGELRVVYVYPFHLELGEDETTLLDNDSHQIGRAVISDLQLSDVWKVDRVSISGEPGDTGAGDDELALASRYGGKVLAVGDLLLDAAAAGNLAGGYTVEIHLNDPGNHYVRISSGVIHDATLHELNQGVRRGSVHMGAEPMTAPLVDGAPGIAGDRGTIAEYVKELLGSLVAVLRPSERGGEPAPHASPFVVDVDRDGHVLVEIQDARLGDRPATPADLLKHAGRILWQPIQDFATALEEWLLLPPPSGEPPNILGFAAQRHELGMSSNGVTVLFSPTAPSWKLHGKKELVEFCVTMPCLLRSWIRRLESRTMQLRQEAQQSSGEDLTIAELEAKEKRLHQRRLEFTQEVLDIRIVRERLEHVAAAANRALMGNMLEAVHVSVYDRALEVRFGLYELAANAVAQRTRTVKEALEADSRRRDEQYKDRVGKLLIAIAILGVADFLSYLNSLFTDTPPEGTWSLVELPFFILVGLVGWLIARKKRDELVSSQPSAQHGARSRRPN